MTIDINGVPLVISPFECFVLLVAIPVIIFCIWRSKDD